MKAFPAFLLSAISHFLVTAQAATSWPRLPVVEQIPVNLASAATGAAITSSACLINPEAMLSEDATTETTLVAGHNEAVIRMAGQQIVEVSRFMNDGLIGMVEFSGSPDGKIWTSLARVPVSSVNRNVEARFAGALAKYIKLSFELTQGGTLRIFKLYGLAQDGDYNVVPASSSTSESGRDDTKEVNWASGLGGARAIYAHPMPSNASEPSLTESLFQFPRSPEKYRTIVYDLGRMRDIRRFSTAYTKRPTRLTIYIFTNLPEACDWRGKLTLDPAIFDKVDPVASAEDTGGIGHMKQQPGTPLYARYIALRFEASDPHHVSHVAAPLECARLMPSTLFSFINGENLDGLSGRDALLRTLALSPLGAILETLELRPVRRFIKTPLLSDSDEKSANTGTHAFEATVEISDRGFNIELNANARSGANSKAGEESTAQEDASNNGGGSGGGYFSNARGSSGANLPNGKKGKKGDDHDGDDHSPPASP